MTEFWGGKPTAREPHAAVLYDPPDFFRIFLNCVKNHKSTKKYTFPTFHSEITCPRCLCPCSMSSCTSCDHHGKRLFFGIAAIVITVLKCYNNTSIFYCFCCWQNKENFKQTELT